MRNLMEAMYFASTNGNEPHPALLYPDACGPSILEFAPRRKKVSDRHANDFLNAHARSTQDRR
jgi:hypothetical protein